MKPHTLIRWSGLAAIVGGVVNIGVSFLQPESGAPVEWGFFLGGLGVMFGLLGIYAFQVEECGVVGLLGFVLAMVGNVALVAPQGSIAGMDVFVVFGSVYALGLVLLAIGSLRARKLSRWVPVVWIVAVVIGLPGAFVPSIQSVSLLLGSVAFGAGFVGAGYTLWTSKAVAG